MKLGANRCWWNSPEIWQKNAVPASLGLAARGRESQHGNWQGSILPPIRTAGMSKAEQKQLPEAVRQTILAKLK